MIFRRPLTKLQPEWTFFNFRFKSEISVHCVHVCVVDLCHETHQEDQRHFINKLEREDNWNLCKEIHWALCEISKSRSWFLVCKLQRKNSLWYFNHVLIEKTKNYLKLMLFSNGFMRVLNIELVCNKITSKKI